MIAAHSRLAKGDTDALAASQDYFFAAGRARVAQLVVVVLVPACVAVWAAIDKRHDSWIPVLGFMAALLDATLFNKVICEARYHAAQLASTYDASLVMKSPSRTRALGSPPPDTVVRRSRSFARSATARKKLGTWHYPRIEEVAEPAAELLYVRSDLAHDEQTREWYVVFLYVALVAGLIGLILVAGANNWAIGDIAANVLFPAVPVFTWLGREVVDHQAALNRKRRLLELIDGTFFSEQVKPNDIDPLVLEREALHGMLFHFRCTQPSVPWWLHAWKGDEITDATEQVLDKMIDDALHSNHARHSNRTQTEFMQG